MLNNTNLYVITSLGYLNTFSIIASELSYSAATYLQKFCACLPLVTYIVLHSPGVSSYRQSIMVKHGQRQVWIVAHPSLFICLVAGDSPTLGTHKRSIIIFACSTMHKLWIWLVISELILCIHYRVFTKSSYRK